MTTEDQYIYSIQQTFRTYKKLAEDAINQVDEKRLFWTFNNDSNSVAMLIQHISGNMLSRFTAFFDEDGEKPWRNRDLEFEPTLTSRNELMYQWNKGWDCLFAVTDHLSEDDLGKTIIIRHEQYTALQAINRQLAHYSYHIGQLVFLCKMLAKESWKSLSIPKK